MSLFRIALRSIQQRSLASCLTILSMALGVMMVIIVLTVHGVVERSFRSNASLGYNMIIGAKGGQEQLVLNSVYYLSRPVENVSYPYYLEFLNKADREREIKNSYAYHAWEARRLANEVLGAVDPNGGIAAVGASALDQAGSQFDAQHFELNRNGKYGPMCDLVIPICLGDYFGRFRVVGTTPSFFNDIVYDMDNNKRYEFARGRNFETENAENGFFEAVVGAAVAREMKVQLGDKINPRHGTPDGHEHQRPFVVVGILKPSGTPNDRAVFVNMEGFYLMEDHAKPLEEEPVTGSESEGPAHEPAHVAASGAGPQRLPLEQREITALLIRTVNPLFAPGIQNAVNEGRFAQAVFPVQVIYNLFDGIVNPVRNAFLVLTSAICVVSGLSILVSIYNSMSERRHEIAVMRALGADRTTVFSIILLESMLLAILGGFAGWFIGHALCTAFSGEVELRTGVSIGFWNLDPSVRPLVFLLNRENAFTDSVVMPLELVIVPGLLLLAVVVGFWPAMEAYRTDVAKSLGK